MAAKGLITTADDEDSFRALMDRALATPEEFAVEAAGGDVAQSVARFGGLVDDLIGRRLTAK